MTDFRIILCTCADRDEAECIAHRLVEEHLAACVNILPGVHSVYRWQGEVETASEVLLLVKTSAVHVAEVQQCVAGLHSYELPEFLILAVSGGSEPYLGWLATSLK